MSKKQKRQKPSKSKAQNKLKSSDPKKIKGKSTIKRTGGPNWPLFGLAFAGMILTGYLVSTNWFGEPILYCADGTACDIVQQSRWGTFLGIPTALLGFLTYALLAFIGLRIRNKIIHWKAAGVLSMLGLGYSIYLLAVSSIIIKTVCFYCLASFLILVCIFALILFQRPNDFPDFSFSTWTWQTVVLVIIVVGGMHLHYSGVFNSASGPEDPYLKGLVKHLKQEKAVLYGAFW